MKQPELKYEIDYPVVGEDIVYTVYISNFFSPVEIGTESTYNQALRKAARNLRYLAREIEEELENK